MPAGRPPHKPTDDLRAVVKRAAGVGLPQEYICSLIGIKKVDTLKKYYADEIKDGRAKSHFNVLNTLYQMAVSGKCPAATFFYCKTQLGFKETDVIEHKRGEEEIVDRPPRLSRDEWLKEYGSTTTSSKVH